MKRAAASAAKDLLIEIGTEELPAHYLPPAIQQLESLAPELLQAARIAHGAVRVYGSPRRLAVLIERVAPRQAAESRTVRGPSKVASLDAQGQPTPALQGFLRKHQVDAQQVRWTDGYAQLTLRVAAAPIAEVLATLVPALIARISFPKTMRWDDSGLTFARPIRWLVVLYGATAVRVTVGNRVSGRVTYGHPAAGRTAILIKEPKTYVAQLKQARVLVEQQPRRALIQQLITAAAKQQGGVIAAAALEHGLLDEVTHLTEDPQALVGSCKQELLALPPAVVVASMSKHQRVFAVASPKDGTLLPCFLLVLDGRPTQPARVRHFAETVLNARLSDAMDFWQQDTQTPLEAKVERLKGLVFHEQLGTVHDKTQRVVSLCAWLIEQSPFPAEGRAQVTAQVVRAARLAKADLATAMVKEFPSLQGIMGGHYARAAGETATVAEAIAKQYQPLGDPFAEILAVADWFDTLTGYFGIGIEPTGSQDPFGLRRCALGILNVLHRAAWHLSIGATTQRCAALWGGRLASLPAPLAARLRGFFKERLASDANLTAWAGGARYDVVRAVLESSVDDLVSVLQRIKDLGAMDAVRSPELLQAASVVERTAHILKGAADASGDVDATRLVEPLEQRLAAVYNNASPAIRRLISAGEYRAATVEYARAFAEPVHAFFDKVLVNAPEAALRRNRLALLRRINELYTADVADLSQLVIETRAGQGAGAVAIAGRR